MEKYFKASKIFLENKVLENGFMVVEDGKIKKILESYDGEYEDLTGKYIAPGLVDTHVHGYKGVDATEAEEGFLNKMSLGLLEMGVTSFLPTTLTSSVEQLNKAMTVIGNEYKTVEGAKVRGIFMEGPFFTEAHKGAQNPGYMTDPSIEKVLKWKELSGGLLNKVALAPERNGVREFVKKSLENGIQIALGHSDATVEQALEAVDAGANIFLHLYNGMSGLHHRKPGMVGAAFSSNSYGELICDGFHVHPKAVQAAINAKGLDRILLVTDCMSAGGLKDGDYKLGEFPVIVKDGQARLHTGSLAGSILKLKDGVKNVYDWNIVNEKEAIDLATKNAAKSVNIDDVCGILKEGRDADFIVLDKELNLERTYIDGKLAYQA